MAQRIQQIQPSGKSSQTKYKVIGIINLIIGFLVTTLNAVMILFVLPRMWELYNTLDIELNPLPGILTIGTSLLFAIVCIFLGVMLVKNTTKNQDKYFLAGIVTIVLMFTIGGFLQAFSVISVINPIYILLGSFK